MCNTQGCGAGKALVGASFADDVHERIQTGRKAVDRFGALARLPLRSILLKKDGQQ
jgi:hypothetical protein